MGFLYLGEEYKANLAAYEDRLTQFKAPSLFGKPKNRNTARRNTRPEPLRYFRETRLSRAQAEQVKKYEESLRAEYYPSRKEKEQTPQPQTIHAGYPLTKQERHERLQAYENRLREYGYVPMGEKIANATRKVGRGIKYTAGAAVATYLFGKKAAKYLGRKTKEFYEYSTPKVKKAWEESKPLREEAWEDVKETSGIIWQRAKREYSQVNQNYHAKKQEYASKKEKKKKTQSMLETFLKKGVMTRYNPKDNSKIIGSEHYIEQVNNTNKLQNALELMLLSGRIYAEKNTKRKEKITRQIYDIGELENDETKRTLELMLIDGRTDLDEGRESCTFTESGMELLPDEKDRAINFSNGEYSFEGIGKGKEGSTRSLVERLIMQKRIRSQDYTPERYSIKDAENNDSFMSKLKNYFRINPPRVDGINFPIEAGKTLEDGLDLMGKGVETMSAKFDSYDKGIQMKEIFERVIEEKELPYEIKLSGKRLTLTRNEQMTENQEYRNMDEKIADAIKDMKKGIPKQIMGFEEEERGKYLEKGIRKAIQEKNLPYEVIIDEDTLEIIPKGKANIPAPEIKQIPDIIEDTTN